MLLISPISPPYLSRHPSRQAIPAVTPTRQPVAFHVLEEIQDGRDMGGMAGGVKGEMKSTEALWIKDFWRSDGRDGGLFAISAIYGPIRNPYFSIKAAY